MTTNELIKIITEVVRKEVRAGIQAELRDILTEAVEVASRPEAQVIPETPVEQARRVQYRVPQPAAVQNNDIMESLLQETRRNMSQGDYANMMSGNAAPVVMSEMPSLSGADPDLGPIDESYSSEFSADLPDFASKAAEIFKAASKKKVNAL